MSYLNDIEVIDFGYDLVDVPLNPRRLKIRVGTDATANGNYTFCQSPEDRKRVFTCKNCGAPVHNNYCEYCGTEY